nr:venom protein [Lampona murina]
MKGPLTFILLLLILILVSVVDSSHEDGTEALLEAARGCESRKGASCGDTSPCCSGLKCTCRHGVNIGTIICQCLPP